MGSILEPDIIEKLMLEAFGASDAGCVRGNNEDYYLVAPALGLYVVADGMGGAQAGEHASKLAAETLWEVVQKQVSCAAGGVSAHAEGQAGRGENVLVGAFQEANRRVMEAAASDPAMEGMGTTLVAVLNNNGGLLVASVGDSRAYLFEQGNLRPVTEDQTWVNEVGRRLGIDEATLKTHPMRHVLTMAIGVSDQLRVHTYKVQPSAGAQVLLCTDGLHGVAEEEELRVILSSDASLETKCQDMIAAARNRGGPDNITAVLLKAV